MTLDLPTNTFPLFILMSLIQALFIIVTPAKNNQGECPVYATIETRSWQQKKTVSHLVKYHISIAADQRGDERGGPLLSLRLWLCRRGNVKPFIKFEPVELSVYSTGISILHINFKVSTHTYINNFRIDEQDFISTCVYNDLMCNIENPPSFITIFLYLDNEQLSLSYFYPYTSQTLTIIPDFHYNFPPLGDYVVQHDLTDTIGTQKIFLCGILKKKTVD